MAEVSIRELRNDGGRVIDRVLGGEQVVITRDGRPVAELRQLAPAALTATELLARWRHVPVIDAELFRADVDAFLDAGL